MLSGERVERRLAAILAADVAGYSRLMGADEVGTLARLKTLRHELIDPSVAEHRGRIVKTTGDGLLIEFPSVVEAVACAVAVQQAMSERNAGVSPAQGIEFRIGINSGDVIVEDGDIHGDGVNIAARLEGIAEPGGICVSAIVHDQVQGRVDCAFDEIGEQQLKNIARPVRVYRVAGAAPTRSPLRADLPSPASGGGPGRGLGEALPLPLPDKPSIAVLPFANMSGDPDQEYFADGMVEEIITTLSRIRWLFVIARNSSFTYKGKAIDVKQVGRELGVRYVLEGSVRKAAGRVRVTAQLIAASSGAHLWADRFDGSMEDVFDLQDKVASSVAGVIEPTVQKAEVRRAWQRQTADLTAYDLYLRAGPEWLPYDNDQVVRALGLFEQVIAHAPRYAPALAMAARCHQHLHFSHGSDDPGANRREGLWRAREALQFGADDPVVLIHAGFVLGYFGEDIDVALRLVDRGLALNPSHARGWAFSGILNLFVGRTQMALEHFETCLRLDPRGDHGSLLCYIGMTDFFERRFEEALQKFLLSLEEQPTYTLPCRFLAACYAHLGRLREASETIDRLRNMDPVLINENSGMVFRNPEHRELYLFGLRLAIGEADIAARTGGSE